LELLLGHGLSIRVKQSLEVIWSSMPSGFQWAEFPYSSRS